MTTRGESLQALIDRHHYTQEVVPGSVRYQLKPAIASLSDVFLGAVDDAITANVALEDVRVPVSPNLSSTIIGFISDLDGFSIDTIDHEHHDLWIDVLTIMFDNKLQVEISYDESTTPKVAVEFIIRPL